MRRSGGGGSNYMPSKAVIEAETQDIEDDLEIYEEFAEEDNKNSSWYHLGNFFKAPLPNRIHELEPTARRPFSVKRSSFFNDRYSERLLPIPPLRPGQLIEGIQDDNEESDGRSSKNSDSTEEGVPSNSEGDYDSASQKSTSSDNERDAKDWKMTECYWFCLKQLFWSRFWLFLIQYIASSTAGARFKTDGFNATDQLIWPGESMFGDIVLRKFLAGFRRWDAQHFLFIADYHYVLEQSLAFFPGYPEIINVVRMGIMSYMTLMYQVEVPVWVVSGIASLAVNFFFFHVSGFCLFMVTLIITRSVKKGLLAVCVLAYNPSSIFFSAAYSESMFFCLSMTGFCVMLFTLRTTQKFSRLFGTVSGCLIFGLTLVVRSNGILNVIFAAWYALGAVLWDDAPKVPPPHNFAQSITLVRNDHRKAEMAARLRKIEHRRQFKRKVFVWNEFGQSRFWLLVTLLFIGSICFVVYFVPWVFMNNSVAHEFCNAIPEQKNMMRKLRKITRMPSSWITVAEAMERTTWCRKPKKMGLFTDYYSAIQAKYWNVGLFGYWKWKKIPCFLMMLPAAILTVLAIKRGLEEIYVKRRWLNFWILLGRSDHWMPLIIHAVILLFLGIFVINAEVYTRLIFSSSPLLYIYIAEYLHERTKGGNGPGNRFWQYENSPAVLPFMTFWSVWNDGWRGKLLYLYIFGYYVFGSAAHAAWLPFT